jgi:hypothetical protein
MTITVVSGQQPKKKFLLAAGQFFCLSLKLEMVLKKNRQVLKTNC